MAELFDESHYFICTNGLSPARIQTNIQTVVKRKDDNSYLTENSLICLKNKDFKCRFIAVICALIAALIVLLACNPAGWVILAALAAAMAGAAVGSIFAGMLCGHKAAIARSWVAKKLFTKIEGQVMVLNSPSTHLTCKVLGGQIYYAPNITCELDATILFCMNVGFAGLEGFMYAFALRGVGLLVTKPMAFVSNIATNVIRSLSPTGILTRVSFGLISREHADLSSRVEGGTEKERSDAFWNAAAFDAKAVQRLVEFDYRDEETGEFKVWDVVRDVSIPMSLGGIPGGARGQDATQVDALRAWENNGAQYRKIINGAKNFRTNLRGRSRGIGSHEQGFFRRLTTEELQSLMRLKESNPALFRNNIARGKVRIIDINTGEVYFEKQYNSISGKKNLDGFCRRANENFPGEKDLYRDSKGRSRWNDSENKMLREMDADIKENQKPNTKIEIEIESQLEPCEVCTREINAREEKYDTKIDVKSTESKDIKEFETKYPEYKNPNNEY